MGVIMATVVSDIDHAVKAIKQGAYNYLLKPLKLEKLKRSLDSFLDSCPQSITNDPEFALFITKSPKFAEIFRRIKSFAKADVPILIEGETGTGKELVAQLIHSLSGRLGNKFVAVNTAALSENLFESELFGYRKGAFTGAFGDHKGYFEDCGKGTLFLDEIGELGREQQKKLLRVLQNNTYVRLGETKEHAQESRLIFATNKNLSDEVLNKSFRDDLYYRINSHTIHLPPLRERPEDIEILSQFFLEKYRTQYGRDIYSISEEAMERLKGHSFPGNVRELEGIMSGAVLIEMQGQIQADSFPDHVVMDSYLPSTLENSKYREVMKVMAQSDGNQTQAAKKLGVARQTLNKWLKEYREQLRYD